MLVLLCLGLCLGAVFVIIVALQQNTKLSGLFSSYVLYRVIYITVAPHASDVWC